DPDGRVREGGDQALDGVRADADGSVGVDDDLPGETRYGGVLRGGLPSPLGEPEQLHAAPGELHDDPVGIVRRRVGDDEDLTPVGRIVDGEERLEGVPYLRGLVVDGDGDGDRRP